MSGRDSDTIFLDLETSDLTGERGEVYQEVDPPWILDEKRLPKEEPTIIDTDDLETETLNPTIVIPLEELRWMQELRFQCIIMTSTTSPMVKMDAYNKIKKMIKERFDAI